MLPTNKEMEYKWKNFELTVAERLAAFLPIYRIESTGILQ
jgi:hypothetical protein